MAGIVNLTPAICKLQCSKRFACYKTHNPLLIVKTDRQLRLPHIHGISEYGFYVCNRNYIRFMYADKVAAWKNVFHINHGLMSNNNVICAVDFKIVLHPLNINNVGKSDPEKLSLRPDKDMIAVYCFDFDVGRFKNFTINNLVNGFGKSFVRNWF